MHENFRNMIHFLSEMFLNPFLPQSQGRRPFILNTVFVNIIIIIIIHSQVIFRGNTSNIYFISLKKLMALYKTLQIKLTVCLQFCARELLCIQFVCQCLAGNWWRAFNQGLCVQPCLLNSQNLYRGDVLHCYSAYSIILL